MKKLVVGMAVAVLGLASFAGVRHVVPQETAGNTPTPHMLLLVQ